MTEMEEFILLSQLDPQRNLRLSCCLPVQAWMDGIEMEVVPPMEAGGRDGDEMA